MTTLPGRLMGRNLALRCPCAGHHLPGVLVVWYVNSLVVCSYVNFPVQIVRSGEAPHMMLLHCSMKTTSCSHNFSRPSQSPRQPDLAHGMRYFIFLLHQQLGWLPSTHLSQPMSPGSKDLKKCTCVSFSESKPRSRTYPEKYICVSHPKKCTCVSSSECTCVSYSKSTPVSLTLRSMCNCVCLFYS